MDGWVLSLLTAYPLGWISAPLCLLTVSGLGGLDMCRVVTRRPRPSVAAACPKSEATLFQGRAAGDPRASRPGHPQGDGAPHLDFASASYLLSAFINASSMTPAERMESFFRRRGSAVAPSSLSQERWGWCGGGGGWLAQALACCGCAAPRRGSGGGGAAAGAGGAGGSSFMQFLQGGQGGKAKEKDEDRYPETSSPSAALLGGALNVAFGVGAGSGAVVGGALLAAPPGAAAAGE